MAASTFADAINALVAERDRQFVLRVCTDYNLKFDELNAKYLETAATAIKVPKKYKKREPKEVTVTVDGQPVAPKAAKEAKEAKAPKAAKACCTAQTSKKEPCKFAALKGEVFCKRHLKQSLGEEAEPKAKKAKKAAQPVHTHALDGATHGECDLCQSHGNPLDSTMTEFEVVSPVCAVVAPVVALQSSVEERLAALLAGSESEPEDEPESEGDEVTVERTGMESEYEDEE